MRFKFRLALKLGKTVSELEQSMSYMEFLQWSEFYQLEPWGYELNRVQLANLQATVANYSGNVQKPLSPSDFMPLADVSGEPLSGEISTKEQVEAWLRG